VTSPVVQSVQGISPEFFIFWIWVFLLLGLFWILAQHLEARQDARSLGILQRNVRVARDNALRTPEDLGTVLRNGVPEDGAPRRRLEHLLQQRAVSASAPQTQALAEAEAVRAQRSLAFPRTLAAVLVLLGLCGALVGLLRAVPEISTLVVEQGSILRDGLDIEARQGSETGGSALDGETSRQHRDRIQKASTRLKELGTELVPAFVASLSGILATVVLSLFLWGAETFQERHVLTPLEELTANWLVPLLTPTDDLGTLKEAVGILASSQDYFSQLTDRLLGQFDQVSAQLGVLYAVVDQFRQASGSLAQDRQALEEAHRSLLDSVFRFQKLAEEVHSVSGAQDSRNRQLVDSVQRLVGPFEALGEQLRRTQEKDFSVLQELVNTLRTTLTGHLDRLEAGFAGGVGSERAELEQVRHESLLKATQEIRQELREHSQALLDLKPGAEARLQGLEAIWKTLEGNSQALADLKPEAQAQARSLEAVRQVLEADSRAAGARHEQTLAQSRALEKACELLARMEEHLRARPQALLEKSPAERPATAEKVQGAHAPPVGLDSALGASMQELTRALEGLPQALTGASPETSDPRLLVLLEQLSTRLEGLESLQQHSRQAQRWEQASLLFLPTCGAAAVGILYMIVPPVVLAWSLGGAGVLTGLLAWFLRRKGR
jgi:hypothetical protein